MIKPKKTSLKKIIKSKVKMVEKNVSSETEENKFNIFARFKAKESAVKAFDFKIEKQKLITIPEGEKANVKYELVDGYAYADIKWDEKTKQNIYNLIEPELSDSDKKTYSRIVDGLLEVLNIELSVIKKTNDAVDYLEKLIQKIIEEYNIKISEKDYLKLMYYIYRNFVGLNEIEALMKDPYIEDISCDGIGIPLFIVHRKYGSLKTNVMFPESEKLEKFITKLAERAGRFISYAEPLLDGSLPDGSRIQASFTKDVTTRGPTFTIRKFVEEPFSIIDLANKGTLNSDILAYLWLAVESGASMLLCGGAGTGKSSLLNALTVFVPASAKIITIEDTRELNLLHENWIPAVTRVGFTKDYGEVTLFDLLKEAFRQSPDYVIVGEVRGQEAYVMFQGMAAGFPCMGTMHAGKVEDVIFRLQSPPISLSPSLIETLDLVVILVHAREKGESARRVKEIVEIESVDPKTGTVRTSRSYNWIPSDDTFEYRGYSWLIQELSKVRGESIDKLKKEIDTRRSVINWMIKQKMTKFKDVSEVVSEYYKNPSDVLKRIKK